MEFDDAVSYARKEIAELEKWPINDETKIIPCLFYGFKFFYPYEKVELRKYAIKIGDSFSSVYCAYAPKNNALLVRDEKLAKPVY